MDTRAVLGLSALRASFLDDVSAAEPRAEGGRRHGAHRMTDADVTLGLQDGDDLDDLDDLDEDSGDDDDIDEDDEDAGDDEEEEETWQVARPG
jgi:hypothetical protein